MEQHTRYQEAKKITLIGAIVNAFLGFLKLFGGLLFHSHALVADGIHSFADLLTDAMVLFASKYGSQDADESHPYGHQRIETAATLLLALVLIIAGFGIAWDALDEIVKGTIETPLFLALPIALISVLSNEGLFYYTKHIGHKINSDLIIANAWHHRSDAASSLVVLIGLIGSYLGLHYLDAVAAVIVGLMIMKMGWSYGWDSVKELIDTAVEPHLLEEIESYIKSVFGVEKVHQLRSRMMGRDVYIDVHIQVAPCISVSEGHYIAQQVHHLLVKNIERVADVTVHVDPEDDELTCPSFHLPNRQQLENTFIKTWQKQFPEIESWIIHFLDGKISIDLICNQSLRSFKKFAAQAKKDLASLSEPVVCVRVLSQEGDIQKR